MCLKKKNPMVVGLVNHQFYAKIFCSMVTHQLSQKIKPEINGQLTSADGDFNNPILYNVTEIARFANITQYDICQRTATLHHVVMFLS